MVCQVRPPLRERPTLSGGDAGVRGGLWMKSVRASMRFWRAVDEHGFVLDLLLKLHRNTQAAKTFLTRLLGEDVIPEVIHTDGLRSGGSRDPKSGRGGPSAGHLDRPLQQHHHAGTPIYTMTSTTTAGLQATEMRPSIPEPPRPGHEPPPSFSHQRYCRRQKNSQNQAFQT